MLDWTDRNTRHFNVDKFSLIKAFEKEKQLLFEYEVNKIEKTQADLGLMLFCNFK